MVRNRLSWLLSVEFAERRRGMFAPQRLRRIVCVVEPVQIRRRARDELPRLEWRTVSKLLRELASPRTHALEAVSP